MKKIILLSLTLVAALFVLSNITKAQGEATGEVELEITAGTIECVYDSAIDLDSKATSYDALTFSGSFDTTDAADKFFCEDMNGLSPWAMTIALSGDILNTTTSNANHTIPADQASIANGQATVVGGFCTAQTVSNAFGTDTLDAVVTILGKASSEGEVCKIETPGTVDIQVITNVNQAVGEYAGLLVVNYPTV